MMRIILVWMVLVFAGSGLLAQDWVLRYDKPAKVWMNEALPVGNGYMGAMFFGGPVTDEVQISEESFWAGGSGANKNYRGGNKRESWKHLEAIRDADGCWRPIRRFWRKPDFRFVYGNSGYARHLVWKLSANAGFKKGVGTGGIYDGRYTV